MNYILSNANVFMQGEFVKSNVFVNNGIITDISSAAPTKGSVVFDLEGFAIFPGFIDVHTHLREPGFFIKRPSVPVHRRQHTAVTPPFALCQT